MWRFLRTPACRGTPAELEHRMGGICTLHTSDEPLCAFGLTKHVAIHAAFPYNRDQMRGQTSFDAYHIFWRAKGPDCPSPSTPNCRISTLYEVGAQTSANVRVLPTSAQRGGNTLLHPFLGIPLSSASLTMCRLAQGGSASVPPRVHRPMQILAPIPGNSG